MNCLDDSLKHEFMTLRHSADNYHTEHEVNIHTDAFERSRHLQDASNKPPSPISSESHKKTWRIENTMTLKQACSSEYQGAQGAFKDSMIHWILQLTLLIAFRCVLHRYESQEIRCWKLYSNVYTHNKHSKLTLKFMKHTEQPAAIGHQLSCKKCTEVWEILRARCAHARKPATIHTRLECNNDPSAGSPTETLLRLLLPLNDQVWSSSQQQGAVSGSPKPIPRPH